MELTLTSKEELFMEEDTCVLDDITAIIITGGLCILMVSGCLFI